MRARAKGKLRAGVSDYQIDNSKLTTHCAPPCKTCRRAGGLALDLISETTVLCTEWGVDGKPSICYCCHPATPASSLDKTKTPRMHVHHVLVLLLVWLSFSGRRGIPALQDWQAYFTRNDCYSGVG
jgi:hypothetical protein